MLILYEYQYILYGYSYVHMYLVSRSNRTTSSRVQSFINQPANSYYKFILQQLRIISTVRVFVLLVFWLRKTAAPASATAHYILVRLRDFQIWIWRNEYRLVYESEGAPLFVGAPGFIPVQCDLEFTFLSTAARSNHVHMADHRSMVCHRNCSRATRQSACLDD